MTKKIELSSTIHLLGEILGSVIKKQENTAIFDKIEKIRTLSKNSRGSNEGLNKQSFKKLKNQPEELIDERLNGITKQSFHNKNLRLLKYNYSSFLIFFLYQYQI